MWYYHYSDEMYHHGIKGMKWGIRRFQNKDGSLTAKGKKRYSDANSDISSAKRNIFQKHKDNLVQKYLDRGYSQSAAETAAKQRIRTEIIVGVVGAVTVGVIAKKAATRIGQEYCDKIIKSGKVIQNIGANEKADFKDAPFFAAINGHDKRAYAMLYPNEKRGMVNDSSLGKYAGIFNNQIKLNKDIRRASVSNARKIFYEKMSSDSDFKNKVLEAIKETRYGTNADKLFKNNPKLFYDRFNQALATPEFQSKGIHKAFYSSLENKGYNAILDINDTRYSGYKKVAKDPTIFFGKDKWDKIGSTKLSEQEIDGNVKKYMIELLAKNFGKTAVKAGGIGIAIKAVSDNKAVENYLKKHPNSKLSRKEILNIMQYQDVG